MLSPNGFVDFVGLGVAVGSFLGGGVVVDFFLDSFLASLCWMNLCLCWRANRLCVEHWCLLPCVGVGVWVMGPEVGVEWVAIEGRVAGVGLGRDGSS